jgi:HAD superfamily hydrolase (TIGR01509 family)
MNAEASAFQDWKRMLRAIIFDFNGVILDDEPLHFLAMREAVADLGIALTEEDYWEKYLPFDDNACLEAICRDHAVPLDGENRTRALQTKAAAYKRRLENRLPIFAGAEGFIASAAQRYPLAVASGANREEIETTLEATGLNRHFLVVVAAEDFSLGKPHPESFLLALEKLNEAIDPESASIAPEECLVIEDSVGGVAGARAAGMRCLAVSNSYPQEKLQEADRVVGSLEEVHLESLPALFDNPA